ncbi:Dynein light chain 1, cytoplasmic [Echinococcus granulosus]|uniref:Dynein light chain n=1 Tax=Echinococcus granulosus TaxID=6210 RepID=U6J4Q9_ECHGR|nr:Dynein light chain 1, cytoplasmic [Echinococcus granulosus]EUB62823.1 Dynein light chain 1, cytoplasmic [Echinococcus granulosus]KAH9280463.1 Dynein light chain 1, cytoplasmic [Echinococcus granulosus]CDS19055.1 dynein light chain [Echinococcus granulosus]
MIGTEFKAVISQTAMSDSMQQMAAEVSADASIRYNTLVGISKFIKEAFEKQYGNIWQCVVGKEFASFISYNDNDFILFRLGDISVLLFRCS